MPHYGEQRVHSARFHLNGVQMYRTGRYYTTVYQVGIMATATQLWEDAPEFWFFPVPRRARFDEIAIEIQTGGSADSRLRLGVYDDDGNGYPASLRLDSGEITPTLVQIYRIPIDLTLEAGLYWLGWTSKACTTQPTTWSDPGRAVAGMMGSTLLSLQEALYGWRVDLPYGPLPATFPAGGVAHHDLYAEVLRLAELL